MSWQGLDVLKLKGWFRNHASVCCCVLEDMAFLKQEPSTKS